jgi:curli production assembly/transport component CsgF
MKKLTLFLIFVATLVGLQDTFSQDFVYNPKNPAFGGDTFNYNWLLSSAQAQDLTEDTRTNRLTRRNTAEDFAQSLNSLLLSQLSRQLISTQFGEDGLQDGTYTFGNFQLDISTTLEGLTITIFDQSNGEQTQIVVPFF